MPRRPLRGFCFVLSLALVLQAQAARATWTAAPGLQAQSPGVTVPSVGLRGEWLFDEGAGATAHDSSIHGNDAIISGPTWVPGRFGTALHFGGTADYVTVSNDTTLEPSSITLSAWVRASGSPGSYRVFAYKGVQNCIASSYSLKSSASGGLVFGIYDGTSTLFSPDAGTDVWDGSWHLVTGTYNGTALRLYVDGVLIGSTPTTMTIDYGLPDGNDFVIGHPRDLCGQTTQFTGDIDEVRIWGRALSAAEVLALQPPIATTVALGSNHNPSFWSQSVTFTAEVAPAPQGGTVTFTDTTTAGQHVLGTVPVEAGTGRAVFVTSSLEVGSHTIRASFGGSGAYQASSKSLRQWVDRRATTTTLTASPNPALEARTITFKATVRPTPDSGAVRFKATRNAMTIVLGTVPLVSGVATLKTSSLAPGTYSVTASYDGSCCRPRCLVTIRQDCVGT